LLSNITLNTGDINTESKLLDSEIVEENIPETLPDDVPIEIPVEN